jgi:NADH:ubiquinone oxidoreductase subunit
MGFFSKIFTWWNGATIGTALFSALNGEHIGTDGQGNKYFRSKKKTASGLERRWVIYDGANDASRVPAEWHGWLHHSYDDLPESHLPPPKIWEVDYTPNPTGGPTAYRPQGALERGGQRARASTDYESWAPEA